MWRYNYQALSFFPRFFFFFFFFHFLHAKLCVTFSMQCERLVAESLLFSTDRTFFNEYIFTGNIFYDGCSSSSFLSVVFVVLYVIFVIPNALIYYKKPSNV